MSKFGKRFLRRATLNSKMGNKNFYKGRTARNEGTHTTKGASKRLADQRQNFLPVLRRWLSFARPLTTVSSLIVQAPTSSGKKG
jgi:hypothetical protein